jgi:predicted GNAT family acetyltransferase
MPDSPDSPTGASIRHDPQAGRFETVVDGLRCELDYRLDGRVMRIHHTGVHPGLEGRGIAAALVSAAVAHARAEGLGIQPLCSYVRAWLRRHPEHADLVSGAR